MNELTIVFLIIALAFFIFALAYYAGSHIESPEKRAGRMGERFATTIIKEILNDDDMLLTNVRIVAEGKQTELDNVIVNSNGVYIIEVKNWLGELYGDEDSRDWIQTKATYGGVYQKEVKNPIGQVKREIYILSRLLKENGLDVWINGYVFFVEMNSPITSEYVLRTQGDINKAIHGPGRKKLSVLDQRFIIDILSGSNSNESI